MKGIAMEILFPFAAIVYGQEVFYDAHDNAFRLSMSFCLMENER